MEQNSERSRLRWRRIWLYVTLAGFALVTLSFLAVASADAQSGDNGTWSATSTTNPGSSGSEFYGISCTPDGYCMAVGDEPQYGTSGTLVGNSALAEQWNGTSWSTTTAINGSSQASTLNDVSCTSANFCMAVGGTSDTTSQVPLAEVWNGSAWAASAPIAITQQSFFGYVRCLSATLCVASGDSYTITDGIYSDTMISEEWSGSSWTQLTVSPPAPSAVIDQMSCPSADSCTAVGYVPTYSSPGVFSVSSAAIEQWNGSSWSQIASPASTTDLNSPSGVWCSSASDCIMTEVITGGSQILSWNGSAWSNMPSATSTQNQVELQSVTCESSTFCMAVGDNPTFNSDNEETADTTVAQLWDGSTWSTSQTPTANTFASLFDVSCVSQSLCMAAGHQGASPTTPQTLALNFSAQETTTTTTSSTSTTSTTLSPTSTTKTSSSVTASSESLAFTGVGPTTRWIAAAGAALVLLGAAAFLLTDVFQRSRRPQGVLPVAGGELLAGENAHSLSYSPRRVPRGLVGSGPRRLSGLGRWLTGR